MRVDSNLINQQPTFYVPGQPVYFDLSQFALHKQPAQIAYTPPTLGEFLVGAACVLLSGYALYKVFEPEPQRRRCSACLSTSHTIARCPHVGERHHFSSDIEKTGECQCCGDCFPRTQLHHYGGRADNGKAKEMCKPCHLHCGHGGHWGNFASNPRYCRLAA
jgi:hypothetical protein